LLGVHRITIYRWLDGSMSVPIVVELLLRLKAVGRKRFDRRGSLEAVIGEVLPRKPLDPRRP
jgi:hypothetical protein